ncbi:hypothetical protein RRG08_024282 [Elysia crispata]|uniref:Uncharacterized protein n=1 Tax=Elysia crispata TaxID=231223 RepID=A0AAE1DFL6_9GAST|nr:hypothetical protein RRG08_024282 [Elysia crispata]
MAGKCCCGNGCNLRAFLIVFLVLTACGIIGVSVFTMLCVPAIKMIETPVWAGGPLLLAALFSLAYCCPSRSRRKRKNRAEEYSEEEEEDEDSACVFGVKVLCVIFLAISFIVCLIAAVFCAVHIFRLFTYTSCRDLSDRCVCFPYRDGDTKRTEYSPVENCDEIYYKVTPTIMASGFLCLVGSLTAMTFITSVFRSRYGQISTGS